jgi:hypothetical protein
MMKKGMAIITIFPIPAQILWGIILNNKGLPNGIKLKNVVRPITKAIGTPMSNNIEKRIAMNNAII